MSKHATCLMNKLLAAHDSFSYWSMKKKESPTSSRRHKSKQGRNTVVTFSAFERVCPCVCVCVSCLIGPLCWLRFAALGVHKHFIVTYGEELPRYRPDLSRDSRPAEFPELICKTRVEIMRHFKGKNSGFKPPDIFLLWNYGNKRILKKSRCATNYLAGSAGAFFVWFID